LVIGGRRSLVSSFLFYQALAYMGLDADAWMIELEHGGETARRRFQGMVDALGDIEVLAQTARGWVEVGRFDEKGPLAREVGVFRLPEDLAGDPVTVRLRLARGSWKLDYLALVRLEGEVEPTAVELAAVERHGVTDLAALAELRSADGYLVTYPGEEYRLRFDVPAGPQELFLESRGFYYEWIREQWLAEASPATLVATLADPAAAMRRLAPAYKRIEGEIEEVFWESRVRRAP
jgi:hypothetical protein